MPIYEFRCVSCCNQWEQLSPVGLVESVCSGCGGLARQIISCPAPPVIMGEGGTLNKFVDKHRYKWEPKKMLSAPRVYEMEFGKAERERLAAKAALGD